MVFYFLGYNKTVKLASEFKAGGIIVFQSTTLDLTVPPRVNDNVAINLLRGEDILLHFSIRRLEKDIVFNSKPAGGNWSGEERVPLRGAFYGTQPNITVYDHGDRFQILTDYETIYYYKKRISANADSIAYLCYNSPVISSPFSDPLFVTTYSSFAGIIPSGQVSGFSAAGVGVAVAPASKVVAIAPAGAVNSEN